ncbi:hypothetical protein [Xanthomonas sacchari]|uniref:hypothetical protein n=1 Tax=Xanthomonas sacchari TaxID=56458 RepID=UPI0012642AC1|nr:hypothetical protein [Xanthomonas sacchari]
MEIFLFEFSLKARFSYPDVASAALSCIGEHVGSAFDHSLYLGLSPEEQKKSIGLEVICADSGYRTLVNGISCVELYGNLLGEFASCMSFILKTEVVIGDYLVDFDMVTGRYLIYYPDGSFRHAYEVKNGGGVFDVAAID